MGKTEVRIMSGKTKGGMASAKMTKEDELLLADFSRGVSAKSSALFYGNSLIVSSIPVWLYWRVHNLDPASSAHLLAIAIIVSTYLLAFAYKNTKYLLKHKIAVKREAAVTKEMNAKLAEDKRSPAKRKMSGFCGKRTRSQNTNLLHSAFSTTTCCSSPP